MMDQIYKYPRTQHVEGSRLQPGDEDLNSVPFTELASRHLVVEEKMDGANCAVSFGPRGDLRLQSRGRYLVGGGRERQFNLLKQWASIQADQFREVLGDRFVMYGEWLYAKHTMFYNALSHYFMEFDVLDRREMVFLDTLSRQDLLQGLQINSVRVLHTGSLDSHADLLSLIAPSEFIRNSHLEDLTAYCREQGLDPGRALRETDASEMMEGLYIKAEDQKTKQVVGRYKYVRCEFLQAVFEADGHWLNRPIIPNRLKDGVDLFAL